MAINKDIFIDKDVYIYSPYKSAADSWPAAKLQVELRLFIFGSLNSACDTWFTAMVISLHN